MDAKENQVYNELLKEIKRRKNLQRLDSFLTHTFYWVSILASFLAAILIVDKHGGKTDNSPLWVALIAGLPGLCLTISKTFDFTQRATWGSFYIIDLLNLRDEIELRDKPIKDASKEFRDLMKKYEYDFTKIGFFNQSFQNSKNDSKP